MSSRRPLAELAASLEIPGQMSNCAALLGAAIIIVPLGVPQGPTAAAGDRRQLRASISDSFVNQQQVSRAANDKFTEPGKTNARAEHAGPSARTAYVPGLPPPITSSSVSPRTKASPLPPVAGRTQSGGPPMRLLPYHVP